MPHKSFKVIVVGRQGAGKTSLIHRLVHSKFDPNYVPTVGIEFQPKDMVVDQERVQLHIWDTAGQEKFKALVRCFYHHAICAVFVYAVNDRSSFNDVPLWVAEARSSVAPECGLVLIGAKRDLPREVSHEEGMEAMRRLGLDMFFETSALHGENVLSSFELITRELIQKAVRQNKLARVLIQEVSAFAPQRHDRRCCP